MYVYAIENDTLQKHALDAQYQLPEKSVWIDLLNLTPEEEEKVEKFLKIDLPTREEMHEIEVSSRLYTEHGALYMTATMVTKSDTLEPETHAMTFILSDERLITIRYTDPQTFPLFSSRIERLPTNQLSGSFLFVELIDVIIDRIADVLERVGQNADGITRMAFRHSHLKTVHDSKVDYQEILEQLGYIGDLVSKTRESLVTINRMISYAQQSGKIRLSENVTRLSTLAKDIASLSDHASFLSSKLNFLLDATLGMINIEQNNIIKIFSVAAVMFLPPTLIASIYGMNFDVMPELHWKYGHVFSLVLMFLSAWIPYKYFKRKKWL
jgi:magnesium transporter